MKQEFYLIFVLMVFPHLLKASTPINLDHEFSRIEEHLEDAFMASCQRGDLEIESPEVSSALLTCEDGNYHTKMLIRLHQDSNPYFVGLAHAIAQGQLWRCEIQGKLLPIEISSEIICQQQSLSP